MNATHRIRYTASLLFHLLLSLSSSTHFNLSYLILKSIAMGWTIDHNMNYCWEKVTLFSSWSHFYWILRKSMSSALSTKWKEKKKRKKSSLVLHGCRRTKLNLHRFCSVSESYNVFSLRNLITKCSEYLFDVAIELLRTWDDFRFTKDRFKW